MDGRQRTHVVEVVLDEAALRAREHPRELIGIDQAAAAGADDLAGVLVEWLEPFGRPTLDGGRDAGGDSGHADAGDSGRDGGGFHAMYGLPPSWDDDGGGIHAMYGLPPSHGEEQ